MDGQRHVNGSIPAAAADGCSGARPLQPNYSSRAVREALEHLSSIDLIELCNEVKIELCRAPRDLRSCGRYVHHVLNSCGHASLCKGCTPRCDLCPICRTPIPKSLDAIRLRLYYECIEAGLISKRCDERFQDREDGESQLNADVQRLYSLFDVALDNNLVSLIYQYVTDVCLDENAVSSDPVTSFLLDEVVVKDWCKRTFSNIVAELRGIYNLEPEVMKCRSSSLLRYLALLAGLSSVVEVMESSFKGSLSSQMHELQNLHESIMKTKQHAEIMMWCIRNEFLENFRPRFPNFSSWCSAVRERKAAAVKRAWPDAVNHSSESSGQDGTLFIEDALANLEVDDVSGAKIGEESELFSLQKFSGSLFLKSKIDGVSGSYPFENLRTAADMLFLTGSSEMVVAKRAIFLYYLYDRHWTEDDKGWRDILDDFAVSFKVTRHLLLESHTFYLLDDDTEQALKEACRLLPEISGSATHPKIPQVLLERQVPEMALMVFRWSGRDGMSEQMSLPEAVTAVRVRLECGLLTEAFTYQRMLCNKVKEGKLKHAAAADPSDGFKTRSRNWEEWMEILVSDICYLCIRRKCVDQIIGFPWNADEEKYLHKCLLDYSIEDPSTITGNLLVVFYLQRYRYSEAYHVDRELQRLEQDYISNKSVDEEVLAKMKAASHWRRVLTDKCMELLPEVEQQLIKSGKSDNTCISRDKVAEMSECPNLSENPLPSNYSLVLNHKSMDGPQRRSNSEDPPAEASLLGCRVPIATSKDIFKSLSSTSRRFSLRSPNLQHPSQHKPNSPYTVSSAGGRDIFMTPFRSISQEPFKRSDVDPLPLPGGNQSLFKGHKSDTPNGTSGKRVHSNSSGLPWSGVPSLDVMDVSWSVEKSQKDQDGSPVRRPRWRSDETSDDEEGGGHLVRTAPYTTPGSRSRRGRLPRR
ncbi:hypothetical protein MLD38_018388 [Melastoma candidum]|uniref:Uncharacterized protein n=1 Tax=Melastoma candidum TaxID=119954 RepID=A0ACB9QTP7_9MYRT|nr:hypothetical protein MLD38_018388 [Melastoma candidum]